MYFSPVVTKSYSAISLMMCGWRQSMFLMIFSSMIYLMDL